MSHREQRKRLQEVRGEKDRARQFHAVRDNPLADFNRRLANTPAYHLAMRINPGQEGWPWRETLIKKQLAVVPVNFTLSAHMPKLLEWLGEQEWWNLPILHMQAGGTASPHQEAMPRRVLELAVATIKTWEVTPERNRAAMAHPASCECHAAPGR